MKSRIEQSQTACEDLIAKFDRRVGMDTNKKVMKIEDGMDRNCRWHNECIACRVFMDIVDIGMQHGFKMIKDEQLGTFTFSWCTIVRG
jgi:hypothetical protein